VEEQPAAGRVGERPGEGALHVVAFDHLTLQGGVEHLDRRSVVLLGPIHGGVGAPEKVKRVFRAVEGQGDADGGAAGDRRLPDGDWLAHATTR
jgi:hypothetical protein